MSNRPARSATLAAYTPAELITELRSRNRAVIAWAPADVQSLRPQWDDDHCEQALSDIADDLCDQSISNGWDIMEALLPLADNTNGKDNE